MICKKNASRYSSNLEIPFILQFVFSMMGSRVAMSFPANLPKPRKPTQQSCQRVRCLPDPEHL